MSRTDVRVHERRVVAGHPAAWWLSVAGVATVLTVTLGALVLVRTGNLSTGSVRALVGTRWQLVAVRSANTSLPMADYVARWDFGRNHRLTGVDGINGLAGTYHVAGDMVTLRVTAAGTAGGTGTIPAQEAMASTYERPSARDGAVTSTFARTATRLTMHSARWTLVFRVLAPSVTSTSPPTPPADATGTVKGRIRVVGGPAPGLDRAVPGVVRVRAGLPGGALVTTVRANRRGRFAVSLLPGRYHLSATTPAVEHGVCLQAGVITIRASRPLSADVVCAIPYTALSGGR